MKISLLSFGGALLYIILIVILTLFIRLILCAFKAKAIKNGEVDDKKEGIYWSCKDYGDLFKKSFLSSSGDFRIDDCWLPLFIGLSELFIFPFLIAEHLWIAIGAWIGIKTASSWAGWQKTRTAYNRFLLGNILSLTFSCLLAWIFFNWRFFKIYEVFK